MAQKINPHGMRLGIIHEHSSKWFADKNKIPFLIQEDFKIRSLVRNFYKKNLLANIEIERSIFDNKEQVKVILFSHKPGVLFGKASENKNKLSKKLTYLTKKNISILIKEIQNPDKVASLIALKMAEQLEKRMSFRKVQKTAIRNALKSGVKGIKTSIAGRLAGADIARKEWYVEGKMPLHTLRADIDFSKQEAHTTYGVLGIKVWLFHGEVLKGQTIENTRNIIKKDSRTSSHFKKNKFFKKDFRFSSQYIKKDFKNVNSEKN